MTHQEFNHIYYLFTNNEKGIKPYDKLKTTGYELKEFVEFAVNRVLRDSSTSYQTQMHLED